ncbi:MAG: FHA domain-containing protein [Deltaproteobacteria bacterium]|nr:FHA domain-containing protein [Deltaproteobacteria bacterium]
MACQLTFLSGARAGSSVRLDQATFWLGRDPRCEVAFDAQRDLMVSSRHAEVSLVGGTWQLRDASTNGTFVNGQPVKQVVLQPGDVIELGREGPQVRFTPLSAAHAAAAGAPSTNPVAQRPVAAPAPGPQPAAPSAPALPTTDPRQRAPQPAPPAYAAPVPMHPAPAPVHPAPVPVHPAPVLVHPAPVHPAPVHPAPAAALSPEASAPGFAAVSGGLASQLRLGLERLPSGQRQSFLQQTVRLGRDPTADVAFDLQADLLVSYNHAKIVTLEGKAVFLDLESTNGSFIDGQPVSRQELRGGEVLELGRGGPRLRVTVTAERVTAPAPLAGAAAARTVFGAAAPTVTDLSLGDAALLGEYPLTGPITIGRDPGCTIVLDSMYISNRHAMLQRDGAAVRLRDAGSANGTFLGGQRISDAPLAPGAEFVIGPYVLKFTGQAVRVFDTRTKTWVDAFGLCRTDPKSGRHFLDHISLKIQPGEFVCILGPSGCGKSTLLKSLNGYTRADDGSVLLNAIDFYAHYEQLKHQVGYVPQDDIIHPQLTIERTLHYAAKLRLPPGTSPQKRKERVQDVLSMLELYDHRHKPVYKLSGGQRKRASIAVELLTEPAIIYLDEPTSGLDPNLEEKMMLLLRELTQRGKTVVTVTHTLDNIRLADKVTFLVDGKLVFFGAPDEARSYFNVQRLPDVYKRFDERRGDLDNLRKEFEASEIYQRHVTSQLGAPPEGTTKTPAQAPAKAPPRSKRVGPGPFAQFWVQTQRYVEIMTRDMRNTAILLLQAPLVALFVCLAVKTDQPDRGPTSTMYLIMSLSALWFGCSNAAREITKESSIYARERMVNLRVIPYVASKFFVLQWLALIQVSTMLVIVYFLRSGFVLKEPPQACLQWQVKACSALILDGVPGNFWLHLGNLYLTALNGIGLGLLVSALAGNSDKAMSLVPLVLIPQVLFSGSFGIPKADEHVKRGVGYAMALNWSLDQSKRISMCTPEEELPPQKGCARCLHAYDPFKYLALKAEDQDNDGRCKAILGVVSNMTDFPESLQVVEDGLYTPPSLHRDGPARVAHRSHLGLAVLGGYNLLLFALICLFVRLKDRQNK